MSAPILSENHKRLAIDAGVLPVVWCRGYAASDESLARFVAAVLAAAEGGRVGEEVLRGPVAGGEEAERRLFESDAESYGFDLARHSCAAPEPWREYVSEATGMRWGGWLARAGVAGGAA